MREENTEDNDFRRRRQRGGGGEGSNRRGAVRRCAGERTGSSAIGGTCRGKHPEKTHGPSSEFQTNQLITALDRWLASVHTSKRQACSR